MEEVERLKKTIRDMSDTILELRNQVAYYKDARSPLVAAAQQELQGRLEKQMPWKQPADGKIELLKQQLRQECAYVLYLEELAGNTLVPFNQLPRDKREAYFKRVDAQVEGGKDPGRFTDPYDH